MNELYTQKFFALLYLYYIQVKLRSINQNSSYKVEKFIQKEINNVLIDTEICNVNEITYRIYEINKKLLNNFCFTKEFLKKVGYNFFSEYFILTAKEFFKKYNVEDIIVRKCYERFGENIT